MSNNGEFVLLTGRANPKLAQEIGKILGLAVDEPISIFADGEIRVRIKQNLRRRMVFVIQPTSTPVNDHIMELLFMIDAAKRASASEIVAIVPYYGYGRQDRKEMSRVPISSSLVASAIVNAGADRILTLDIHSEQQEGFISKPWDNIYGSYSILPELKKKKLTNLVVAAPDKGGTLRATGYAKLLGAESIALVYKKRDIMLSNVSKAMAMIGNVKDKNVLIVDDMIDSGGTIVSAADLIHKKGAKSIRVVATHGIFSGDALNKINKSHIEEIIVTDSIVQKPEVINSPKISVISVAPLLAEAIKRVKTGESISKDLIL